MTEEEKKKQRAEERTNMITDLTMPGESRVAVYNVVHDCARQWRQLGVSRTGWLIYATATAMNADRTPGSTVDCLYIALQKKWLGPIAAAIFSDN